jgi:hypothetical protein
MYKVLIACRTVRWAFWDRESRHRGSKGIRRVQNMINVTTWAWCRDDIGEFDDVELQELCVMLVTDRGWNFDNSSEASHFKIVTAPVLAVSAVAPAHPAPAMEDDTGQGAAWWGWVEPTWFKISVYMMSGKVIVVDVSSRQTFGQVKFWIWANERILPCQQHRVWNHIEVDDTYWIVESCDVSLVVYNKVSSIYKVVISRPSLHWKLILYRGQQEGEGIQWVVDVGMFTDGELDELRVLLARKHDVELGIKAA